MKIKLLLSAIFLSLPLILSAQDEEKQKSLEIYGFVMTDIGYNFGQTDAAWFDVMTDIQTAII